MKISRKVRGLMLFSIISIAATWAFFYTFSIFPWGPALRWWNIPHLVTALSFLCWVVYAAAPLLDTPCEEKE